ncbi:hypothetical protein ABW21_db0202995 [Orbilia brochopaga]|nr:hypothetical protein ABW21_db0202995 [Drechslerella brochopaga]
MSEKAPKPKKSKKFVKGSLAAALRKTLFQTTGIVATEEMERRVYGLDDETITGDSNKDEKAEKAEGSPTSIYSDDSNYIPPISSTSSESDDTDSVSSDEPQAGAQVCMHADEDISRKLKERFINFDLDMIQDNLLYHQARMADDIPGHVALIKACVAYHFPDAAVRKREELFNALTEKQIQYLLEPLPENSTVVVPDKEIAWIALHGGLRLCQLLAAYDQDDKTNCKKFRNEIAALYEGMFWLFDTPPEVFVRRSQNETDNMYFLTAKNGVVRTGGHWLDGLVESTRGTFKEVVKRARKRDKKERREAMRMLGWKERPDGWREPVRDYTATLHVSIPNREKGGTGPRDDGEGGGSTLENNVGDPENTVYNGEKDGGGGQGEDDGLEGGYEFA